LSTAETSCKPLCLEQAKYLLLSSVKFIRAVASYNMQLPKIVRVSPKLVKEHVIPRLESSKKGDNGTVLVVGGSRIYHGAPLLTSMAALRSGVDLLYTAVPRSNIIAVRSFSPNIIALPLPDDKLTMGSANRLMAIIPKKPNTAAIGMGMSIAEPKALIALIKQLKNGGTKLLLDASSLIPLILKEISGTGTIITPHAGEYKRIFEEDIGVTEKEQISNVQRHAKEYGITIILKGRVDIVSDGERVAINKIHNCAMTVGGTGDVLSGVVAGLLAKLKYFDASILGVYFNGVAGNLAYKRVGLHMLATDLIEDLPNAFKPFDIIKK
jgi:ADP-dependent NAD(P)H-hydrate dehydratase